MGISIIGGSNMRFFDRQRIFMVKKFTLIELLIVIAIIAILAAMLLPALNKARQSAFKAACLANQKQLLQGYQSYADSFDGWVIPGQWFFGDDYWMRKNLEQLLGHQPRATSAGTELYNQQYKLFRCPAEPIGFGSYNSDVPPRYSYTHYAINTSLTGAVIYKADGSGDKPAKTSNIKRASETILLVDNGCKNTYSVKASGASYWQAFRHGGNYAPVPELLNASASGGTALNIGYFDGHAATMFRNDFRLSLYNNGFKK